MVEFPCFSCFLTLTHTIESTVHVFCKPSSIVMSEHLSSGLWNPLARQRGKKQCTMGECHVSVCGAVVKATPVSCEIWQVRLSVCLHVSVFEQSEQTPLTLTKWALLSLLMKDFLIPSGLNVAFPPDADIQTGASDFNQKKRDVCAKVTKAEYQIMVQWPAEVRQ